MASTADNTTSLQQGAQSDALTRRLLNIVAAVLVVAHAVVAVWRVTHSDSDLISFHRTALHWWHTGRLTGEFGVWFYVPAFVPLIAMIAVWPLPIAGLLMAAVNMLLLASSVRMCSRLAARGDALPVGLFWGWPVLLALPFASDTVQLGQVNLIVLWLCVAAYVQVCAGHQNRAGCLIALAGVIKLYPLIFAFYWLLKGRWCVTLTAALAFVVIACSVSLAAFGWRGSIDAHRYWWESVYRGEYRVLATAGPMGEAPVEQQPDASAAPRAAGGSLIFRDRASEFHRYNNQSLAAVIRRLTTDLNVEGRKEHRPHLLNLSPTQAQWAYRAVAGVLMLWLALSAWRRRQTELSFAEWSGWLASVIAFVPIWWTHYFVLLLPAATCLGVSVWRRQRQGRRALGAEVLQACWLVGMVLLAWPAFRWVGGNAWLALAVMAWAVWSSTERRHEDRPESGAAVQAN